MNNLNKTQQLVIEGVSEYEYLYHFVQNVKIVYPNLCEEEIKKKTLQVIYILLKKKILTINNVFDKKKWDLPIDDSIIKIQKIWFSGASYPDFINMMFFTTQEWFYEKLKKKGYNFQDNWVEYVNDNNWLKKTLKIKKEDLSDENI